jgi:hypothetical protein
MDADTHGWRHAHEEVRCGFIESFWLVLGDCGCGGAALAAAFPEVGIGLTGPHAAWPTAAPSRGCSASARRRRP